MKIIKLFSLTLAVLILAGCSKDFEEINTNKNNPTSVTPDLLISGIIRSAMEQQVNEAWSIGNIVSQYHAKIQFVNEDRYGWNQRNGIWNNVYSNYRDLQNLFVAVNNDETNPYYGVGLVMKSWMFSLLADAYGDVPYSEAGKAKTEGLYQPAYDKQEDIYSGILNDLSKANEVLANASGGLSGDILFGGGTTGLVKWRKLANSLRLRYLMRLSKQRDVAAQMQAIVSNPAQYPIFESNDDNAELKYQPAAPYQWPLYSTRVGSFDEFRVSKTLADRLSALGDTRLNVFGRPTQASVANNNPVIEGVPNGLSDVDALAYNGGVQNVSRIGYTFACLVCNDQNQPAPVPNAARALLMTYSELQFILAEARLKNLISIGTVANYYNEGITANFNYWKTVVPVSYNLNIDMPAGYLNQSNVVLSGTITEMMEKIALQKWVALYFNGLEAWFDWKRTGLPVIVPGPANLNANKVPVRFIYPLSEQTLNGDNRNAAVQRQGADDLNTRTWIFK